MKYYIIKPEVPASIGSKSVFERETGQSMKIIALHLEFQGWLGDDLMETHPVFYVTEKLKAALQKSKMSGIEDLCQAIVTQSDSFVELYPNKNLPQIFQLKINGKPYEMDFGIDKGNLVISENAKVFLKMYNLSNAEIIEVKELI